MDAKLIAFLDESGTHDRSGRLAGSRQIVVAGWLAWYDEWVGFSRDWKTTLDKYGAPHFHFSEWAEASAIVRNKRNPSSKFQTNPYKGWSLNSLDNFLIELGRVAGAGNKMMIGGYVNTRRFEEAKRDPRYGKSVPAGGDPYRHCLLEFFERFLIDVQSQWPLWTEPVTFVFDQNDDPQWCKAVREGFDLVRRKDGRVGDLVFADKNERLPLQAADMVAYRCRQIGGHFLDYKVPSKLPELDKLLFRTMFEDFEAHPGRAISEWLKHEAGRPG